MRRLSYMLVFTSATLLGQTKQIDSLKLTLKISNINSPVLLEELCFQFFAASRQDSIAPYQSKLNAKVKDGKDLRLRALSEFYLAQTYFLGDTTQYFQQSEKALTVAMNSDCAECIALHYLGIGLRQRKFQRNQIALDKFMMGLSSIEEGKGKRIAAIKGMLFAAISSSYNQLGKFSEALQYGLDAMRIAEASNDIILKNKVYTSLSAVYGELSTPNSKLGSESDRKRYKLLAKHYLIKSYESSVALNNKRLAGTSAYNLGLFYGDEAQLDSSSYYLNIAAEIAAETKYWELASNTFNIMAINYAETNPDTALMLFDESLKYARLGNLIRNQATAVLSKANVLQMKGRSKEAIFLAEEGLKLGLQSERRVTILNAYKILSELNEETGNLPKAYDYFKKHVSIKDSMVNEDNLARIDELKAQYDVELKDKEIKNLSQLASIQALEIRQRNWIVASLALFIVMGGAGIWLFIRSRTLSQKQIIMEAEQRLNRARMNPHFFFNALTSLQQHALRQTDGLALATRLSQFSEVMRKTLESTYMEYTTIEEETSFLTQYLEIQKNRYPVSFDFSIKCESDLEIDEMLIPPMIIQPFVENSIEHGLTGINWPGNISIQFKKVADELYVEVTDNGKGLSAESSTNSEHISRATEIIKDRIYLLATKVKSKARFSVGQNPAGKGVLVAIYLPLLYKNARLTKQA